MYSIYQDIMLHAERFQCQNSLQRKSKWVYNSPYNDRLLLNFTISVMTVARKPRETIVNFPGEGDTSDTYLTLPPQLHSNSSGYLVASDDMNLWNSFG